MHNCRWTPSLSRERHETQSEKGMTTQQIEQLLALLARIAVALEEQRKQAARPKPA